MVNNNNNEDVEIEIIDEDSSNGVETPSENLETQDEAEIEIIDEDDGDDEGEDEKSKPKKKNKTASYIDKLKAEIKELKAVGKTSKTSTKNVDVDEIKLLRFEMKNPDAEKYMDDIRDVISTNPNLGYERAYALIKAEKGESQTVQNFSISKKKVVRKKLSELTQEEAIAKFKNDPKSYVKWRNAAGL